MATEKIDVPAGPSGFPPEIVARWREEYAQAYAQSKGDQPDAQDSAHSAAATIAANRTLKVKPPTSFKEAMAMPEWQVVHRGQKQGKVTVVTIDGKKYKFDAKDKDKDAPKD